MTLLFKSEMGDAVAKLLLAGAPDAISLPHRAPARAFTAYQDMPGTLRLMFCVHARRTFGQHSAR